jgi:hypothetical protein
MAITMSRLRIEVLLRAASDICWRCSSAACDGTNAAGITQANQGEEETNTTSTSDLDGGWQKSDKPLTHAYKGQEDEDEAFNEYSSKRQSIRDGSSSVKPDDLVSEIGIETHSRTVGPLANGGLERCRGGN